MASFDPKGRVALVTGGNGGIGLGMAKGLASAGAAVGDRGPRQDEGASGSGAVARERRHGGLP